MMPAAAPTESSDDARTAAVEGLAGQVAGTLRLSAALARGGRRLDLDGLDRMVGRLCAQALDLPPAQGRRVRPLLAGLLADLDALGALLAPD
jgi:hypothetical protein